METDAIHIAYALNDNYAEMTSVSICSVLANCEDEKIVFHLFAEQLSQVHIEKLSGSIKKHSNCSMEFHDIRMDEDLFVTARYDGVKHAGLSLPNLTKEAYARILFPELLFDLERLIYLDCDTIIEGNIAQLWQVDLGGALAGVVPDYSLETKDEKNKILGMRDDDVYFNSGVILMDLSGLRRFQLSRIAAENVSRLYYEITNAGLHWYADQDVLNFALRGAIKLLPMSNNSYFWISFLIGVKIDECIEACLNPLVVHFIGTPKPTELGKIPVNVPEWERYYKYKAISPYAADSDAVKTALFKERESNTFNSLIPAINNGILHWFCYRFAKQMFMSALEQYMNVAKGKNVVIWGLNERTWTLAVFLKAHGLVLSAIVDGLESNQGRLVFDYDVESPDVLQNSADETFVMLDMRSGEIARKVADTLRSWGYIADDYYHVYVPIWEDNGILVGQTAYDA